MVRVYCDTGAFRAELKKMCKSRQIELWQFHYENRNKNINVHAPPSNPSWFETNYSWAELGRTSWESVGRKSEKVSEITRLIGNNNSRDIKHLDSAYLGECKAFLTSDKGDICSKKEEIYHLLKIRVFHFIEDWVEFENFCASCRHTCN